MNRLALGLAVGAGYVLGRTKKMKLAFAIGTMVAGKRMHLSPRALADLVSQQLQNNPQFKEIGDQLREDLRGVGQAASGALVERQLDAFADRLHGRTAQVRDQLEGVVPETPDLGLEDEEPESEEPESEEPEPEAEDEESEEAPRRKAAKKAPAKKGAARTAESAVKKAPAKKTATKKAPAKKTAAKKTAAKKTAAKKTTAASGAARSARAGVPKGGGER